MTESRNPLDALCASPPTTSIAAAASTAARMPARIADVIRTIDAGRHRAAGGHRRRADTRRVTPRSSARCSAWAGSWRRRGICAAACSATSSSAATRSSTTRSTTCRGRRASRAAASASTSHSATTRCTSTTSTSARRFSSGATRPDASSAIVHDRRVGQPKIVLGDFNEWMRGLATTMLSERLQSIDLRAHLRRRRTYPGVFPVLHLDHIYYEGQVEVVKAGTAAHAAVADGVGSPAARRRPEVQFRRPRQIG